jgi:hypothetical protein
MAEVREPPTFVVSQTQSPPFESRLQHAVLFAKERDHILLLTLQPPTNIANTNWNGNTAEVYASDARSTVGHYGTRSTLGILADRSLRAQWQHRCHGAFDGHSLVRGNSNYAIDLATRERGIRQQDDGPGRERTTFQTHPIDQHVDRGLRGAAPRSKDHGKGMATTPSAVPQVLQRHVVSWKG